MVGTVYFEERPKTTSDTKCLPVLPVPRSLHSILFCFIHYFISALRLPCSHFPFSSLCSSVVALFSASARPGPSGNTLTAITSCAPLREIAFVCTHILRGCFDICECAGETWLLFFIRVSVINTCFCQQWGSAAGDARSRWGFRQIDATPCCTLISHCPMETLVTTACKNCTQDLM